MKKISTLLSFFFFFFLLTCCAISQLLVSSLHLLRFDHTLYQLADDQLSVLKVSVQRIYYSVKLQLIIPLSLSLSLSLSLPLPLSLSHILPAIT